MKSEFSLSPIKEIELAASRIPGAISLAQGIPSFSTPQLIKDFVYEKIQAGACDRYSLTTGLSEFREEVALNLAKDGLIYDPDTEIIATCGAAEAMSAAIMASVEPGDEVIVPSPTYASYRSSIGMARAKPVFVALDEDRNFDFHVDRIKQSISRNTRAIIYCSPNNPTGTLFSEEKIRKLVELALKHNLVLIMDEVYKDFYYTSDKHFTAASIKEARQHCIRICSFSKAFAMTGWRIGFLHCSAERMSRILKYHDAMVTCAPVVSQYAGIAAFRFGDAALAEFKQEFRRRRDFVVQRLDQLSDVLDYQVPNATYFVFPRIKDTVPFARDSRRLAYDILERSKVALVPGSAFGPTGEQHLRISYGRELKDLGEGLDRLSEYFHKARGAKLRQAAKAPMNKALARRAAEVWLKYCSRLALVLKKRVIIGIAGTHSKTVFKRKVSDTLQREHKVRAGILSYNTEIGLPLSVLNLTMPFSLSGRLLTMLKAGIAAISPSNREDILVLEYGVNSVADAEALLRIVRPDWLVITGLTDSEPGTNYEDCQKGVLTLARAVSPSNLIWRADDNVLKANLEGQGAPISVDSHGSSAQVGSVSNGFELVGESSTLAFQAANTLLTLLRHN